MTRRSSVGCAVALLCWCACDGAGPRDVLLITVDTLRADHLGLYGYSRPTSPNIDQFFSEGSVFERAYSTASYTSASITSLLTGRYPQEHRVRLFNQLLPEQTELLTELLPTGYQTAAFVSNPFLHDQATGLAARFDHYDDAMEPGPEVLHRSARETTTAVLSWLRNERDPGRATFVWVHYMDPHSPYGPLPDRDISFRHAAPRHDPERIPLYARESGETDLLYYVDRYDEEIAFVDREVSRLLEGYARLAPLESALIIFSADHGETLIERRLTFSHAHHVYEELVRVPLMLRGPGVPAMRRGDLVSLIDVVPTVLAFAGARDAEALEGVDLRSHVQDSTNRTVFAESHRMRRRQWRTAIGLESKWTVAVAVEDGQPVIRKRWYHDLRRDPGEARPVPWPADAEPAAALVESVESDPDPAGTPVAPREGQLGDELRAQLLRKLGYLRESD